MLITYQKRNGEIFQRIRNTYCPYRVGEETSMGWKVLDIKYKYKDKYYSLIDYDNLIEKAWKRDKKMYEIKQTVKTIYKNLNYVLTFLILVKILEYAPGILAMIFK